MPIASDFIEILDCTIRDGTYTKDFQVTADEADDIARAASAAGVQYFETGHGLGIGGAKKTKPAAISDVDYCLSARKHAGAMQWGTFCIAGICTPQELTAIIETRPDFIRIGLDPGHFDAAYDLVGAIMRAGLTPMIFYMKSYAWLPDQLHDDTRRFYDAGVKTFYIVDSAGHMLPADVTAMCGDLKKLHGDSKIGFHGHNNLGLAVANSLAAIDGGASIIDCSMMGVGRSSGNCCLEQFAFVMDRKNIRHSLDVHNILEFSAQQLIKIFPPATIKPLDIVCGYSGFHTAFLKKVFDAAHDTQINPYRLIIEVSRITQVEPTAADLDLAISRLCEKKSAHA